MKKSLSLVLWTVFALLSWGAAAHGQGGMGGGPAQVAPQPAPAAAPSPAPVPAQARAGATADKPAKPEEVVLNTTDGLELHAWYYPAKLEEDGAPTATVILLHDLEGSHRSLEPLAQALQAAGCDVVSRICAATAPARLGRAAISIHGCSRRPTSN